MTVVQVRLPERGTEFLVACLCAEWCGSCRDYRAGFEALALRFPAAQFVWIDVEDEPEVAGDVDIENFPTMVIQRVVEDAPYVLFCGAMQPYVNQLDRLLQTLMSQTPDESRRYASANAERLAWQDVADVHSRLGAA